MKVHWQSKQFNKRNCHLFEMIFFEPLLTKDGEISRDGTSVEPIANSHPKAKWDCVARWERHFLSQWMKPLLYNHHTFATAKMKQNHIKRRFIFWPTYECKKQFVVPFFGLFLHLSISLNIRVSDHEINWRSICQYVCTYPCVIWMLPKLFLLSM